MKTLFKNKYVLLGATLFIGFLLGWLIKPSNHHPDSYRDESSEHQHNGATYSSTIGQTENQIWTCSMHPQIRMNEPGQCPICGMDLIPAAGGGDSDANPMALEMTENAMKLANIQTTVVGSESLSATREIRLNGKVQADERKVYVQSSHIPGRIEQLNVNFTGEPVFRGKVLAMVYSPELVTAQQELLQANKIKSTQPELFNAAKNKLINWKLSETQINRILENGKPIDRFPILSDVNGIAVEKKVNLGDYVQRGTPVYEIADLSSVWLQFEVYESDLPWVKVGDKVSYTLSSIPGEKFEGVVAFIDPVIDPQTRVTMARVEVKNPKGTFKPEMFATGKVKNELKTSSTASLSVPKSAVMWTGERSVVYVKTATDTKVYFSLREVTLGASLGDAYEVKSGLEAGEEIVTYGTFTVDAAAQLAGKPSMMRPEGGAAMTGHNHGGMNMDTNPTSEKTTTKTTGETKVLSKEAKAAVEKLVNQYILVKNALVKDNLTEADKQVKSLQKAVSGTSMALFKGDNHNKWMDYQKRMNAQTTQFLQTKKIDEARTVFIELSNILIEMTHDFGPFEQTFYIQYCPMVNQNKGAEWLSISKTVENPYYGAKMNDCGEVTKTIQ
ncbi:MAG: efflux RND transporter periplasmic adaptor subunit [Bacteroidetes bacterium]|nr:efflux RND transporter periplasmic adaptor subunit [Bacteroidota bacterium]